MFKIDIQKAQVIDKNLINEFFEVVLNDTFKSNEISNMVETLEEEINDKRRILDEYFDSEGHDSCFFIAKDKECIVGSVAYGVPNNLILTCTKGEWKGIKEIGTVFVHPQYQRKGIGSELLITILNEMNRNELEEFCLDSGYKIAQKIWTNKLGKPEYLLENYWGKDADHMIWRKKVTEVLDNIQVAVSSRTY
jgi:GNAT superfamily N-acetyltransferase